ncbi:ribonuclease H-like domain-containing protein [Tanacetum coccineum]
MDLETAQITTLQSPVTTEEKVQKKNDVKERSMLLMALPNEHLMTFNQYKDAKTLFAAIQTRFGGNEATKKTQKTLLKQMYENFSALRTESLDSIFNKNKPDLDTMSFNNLYNNFKIVKQEVKGTASSCSSLSSHNMAFVSSPSSTNKVNTAYRVSTATQVSPASTQVSTASTQVSTVNLSDDTVYAFLASQPNGSQLVYEDLKQIHEDDIEEMDLKCQLALLGMGTRRGPRNQDSRNRNQDSSRRTVNVEETSSKAIVAIDEAGFDWSNMANDEVPINMALMAFLDSKFNKSEFNLATYKRGLASVEEQLVFYKNNKVILYEQLDVLKRDISYKDSEISMLKRLFSPPNLDLSYSGLEEFQQPEFEGYGPKTSKSVSKDISNEVRESPDALLVEELVSDDKLEKKTVFPTVAKIEFVRPKQQEKQVRKLVSFDHVQADCNYHQRERVVSGNNYTRVNYNYSAKKTHPSAHRSMVPIAVLMKTGLRSLNTARPVNTAHPKTIVYSGRPMSRFSKSAQSTVYRPYQIRTTLTNKNFSQKVNTAKGKFYTARPKAVNTARPNSVVVNVVRANQGHPQKEDQGYVDSGCLRHVTGNNPISQTSRNLMKDMLPLEEEPRRKNYWKATQSLLCDNGTKFKNRVMSEFCKKKGIKKEFSVARTPQQNDAAEKKEIDVIELLEPCTKESIVQGQSSKRVGLAKTSDLSHHGERVFYYLIPYQEIARKNESQPSSDARKKDVEGVSKESGIDDHERPKNSAQDVNTVGPSINTASSTAYTDHAILKSTHANFFGRAQKGNPGIKRSKLDKSSARRASAIQITTSLDIGGFTIWQEGHWNQMEEGIDYDDVFALVARIEAIRLFLAYASFKDFVVYQMDVKSAFLYGKIEEEVYVCQPPGFEDPEFPDKVYKVYKEGEWKDDGIFISQDKYVDEILKKFGFSTVKTSSTPMETSKPLLKDAEAEDVDVYLYRSMIGSLMYLTASRPDIMFVVCACARFQVTPKVSHLHAVKRIFRYLKGQPKLGLCVTPPKFRTTQRNGNIGVLLQGNI